MAEVTFKVDLRCPGAGELLFQEPWSCPVCEQELKFVNTDELCRSVVPAHITTACWNGVVRCDWCNHEWEGAGHVSMTENMRCPSCGNDKGSVVT